MATQAQARRAAKDRVIEAARELVRTGVLGSVTPGSRRSYGVDAEKLDRLRDMIAELDR